MNKKAETVRDRRVSREEEKRLLDTALGVMNTARHMYVGEMLHDRIIGALELCCRRGEMLLIQNKRVNWDTCQIGIPGATAKDKENRRIPFNPRGRLAAILRRRAALGPEAYVFGSATGTYQLLALTLIRNPSDGSSRILPVTKQLIAGRRVSSSGCVRGVMHALGGGRRSPSFVLLFLQQ